MHRIIFFFMAIVLLTPGSGLATAIKPGSLIVSEIMINGTNAGGIYAFDPASKELSLIATGGLIDNPEGMAITSDGKIIVADWYAWDTPSHAKSGNRGIYSIDPDSGKITSILANGPLVTPIGVVIGDDGNLIVIDHGTNSGQGKVFKIDANTGAVLATKTHANMYTPQGIVKDEKTGIFYVADQLGYILKVNQEDLSITKIGRITGTSGPQDLIITEKGKLMIVTLDGRIFLMDPATGAYSQLFNDDTAKDAVPSGSSFDSLAWINKDTFAVVNHFSAGDIFSFHFDQVREAITSSEILYFDGLVNGGPLFIPLGVERYDPEPVPEPTTLLLLGTGLVGLASARKRTTRQLKRTPYGTTSIIPKP